MSKYQTRRFGEAHVVPRSCNYCVVNTYKSCHCQERNGGGKVIRVLVIVLTKARRLWRCDVVGICHTVARGWLLCNCTAFLSPVGHPRWIPSCQDSWSPVGCHPPKTCLALPTSMFACGKKPWAFSWLTGLQAICEKHGVMLCRNLFTTHSSGTIITNQRNSMYLLFTGTYALCYWMILCWHEVECKYLCILQTCAYQFRHDFAEDPKMNTSTDQ